MYRMSKIRNPITCPKCGNNNYQIYEYMKRKVVVMECFYCKHERILY